MLLGGACDDLLTAHPSLRGAAQSVAVDQKKSEDDVIVQEALLFFSHTGGEVIAERWRGLWAEVEEARLAVEAAGEGAAEAAGERLAVAEAALAKARENIRWTACLGAAEAALARLMTAPPPAEDQSQASTSRGGGGGACGSSSWKAWYSYGVGALEGFGEPLVRRGVRGGDRRRAPAGARGAVA